jgi:hypothetical protein
MSHASKPADPAALAAWRAAEGTFSGRAAGSSPSRDLPALADADAVAVLVLYRRGMTAGAIAAALELPASDVETMLGEVTDTRTAAKGFLEASALRIARSLAAHADDDGEIGLELADRLGFAEKRQDASKSPSVSVVLGVTLPGLG